MSTDFSFLLSRFKCREEVIGKNCRFLQGQDTDPASVDQLRDAISQGEACTVELLNYTKNGTPFWNRLSITPIHDDQNLVTHYVGVQSDITILKQTKERLISLNKELESFKHRIINELDQAKLVQQFLLPGEFPYSPKVNFASLFVPLDEIGGDFFDVISLPDDKYGLLIADVSGHGIPAALLTFMSSTTFTNIAPKSDSPSKIISMTNMELHQKLPEDAFVTMFYAIYDSTNGILKYAQAGHPEAYVLRPGSNEIIPIHTEGTLIGPFTNDEVSFQENSIQLTPGDKLILYTDAITDVLDEKSPHNANDDFKNFLLKYANLPLENLFKRVYDFGLKKSKRKSYADDFTLLGMEVIA